MCFPVEKTKYDKSIIISVVTIISKEKNSISPVLQKYLNRNNLT